MSPLSSGLHLEKHVRQALVDALQLKLPPGPTPTLDQLETAAVHLLRELGPQLLQDAIQGVEEDPKKGALLGAVGTRRNSKGGKHVPS